MSIKLVDVIHLDVPYEMKEEAKKQKCFYFPEGKVWTCKYNDDNDDYDRKLFIETYQQVYLNVPYDDKDDAKANGAKWDANSKTWYTYKGNEALKKYM